MTINELSPYETNSAGNQRWTTGDGWATMVGSGNEDGNIGLDITDRSLVSEISFNEHRLFVRTFRLRYRLLFQSAYVSMSCAQLSVWGWGC